MAYEQKDGDISIFANEKGDNDKRPDYRGDALIGGQKFRVSLWLRTAKDGGKRFLSGKIERAPAPQASASVARTPAETDDAMPF